MTNESILGNIQRLLQFFCLEFGDDRILTEPPSCEFLLRAYGRWLDVNGCPASGFSLLYLPEADFNELKKYAHETFPDSYSDFKEPESFAEIKKQFPEAQVLRPNRFTFQYDGYHWAVEIKNYKTNQQ